MAQQGKIEFSLWYSLAKWHRTVDRQTAAVRTCPKTAGKGNSTCCLQTWTHMSENAQNIAFFTRFVGADFRILLTVEHCDHCEHEIHNRVWVLELELNELQFWVLLWSFSCASFSFQFLSPQDLERTRGSVATLQDATDCPDAAVLLCPCASCLQTTHLVAVTGRNPGRFRILLTVEHCDHCEHEIHNRVWVLELELNELRFWVLLWSFSFGSELNFIVRKILKEQEVQLPSIHHLRFCLKRVVLGCSSRAMSAKSNGFVTPWGTAFKILTAEPWNLLDAMAFHTELQDLRGQTNLGASGIRFDVEWNFIRTSPKLFLR